jgi:hypothetical protein
MVLMFFLAVAWIGIAQGAVNWDSKTMYTKVASFLTKIAKGEPINVVAEKTAILNDLLNTPYRTEFDKKVNAATGQTTTLWNVQLKALQNKDEKTYKNCLLAEAELEDLTKKIELVKEDYYKAEVTGVVTGQEKPKALRFEVVKATVEPVKETPEVKAYKLQLPEAQKVVSAALAAIKAKNMDAYANLWNEASKLKYKAEQIEWIKSNKNFGLASTVAEAFQGIEDRIKNGYKYDLLPTFAYNDKKSYSYQTYLEGYADRLKNDKKMSVDTLTTDKEGRFNSHSSTVYLVKEKGKWVIDDMGY